MAVSLERCSENGWCVPLWQLGARFSALQWHRRDLDPMEAGISERSWTIHTKVNTEIPQSHPIRTLVFQGAQAANPSEKPALQKSPRFRKLWPLENLLFGTKQNNGSNKTSKKRSLQQSGQHSIRPELFPRQDGGRSQEIFVDWKEVYPPVFRRCWTAVEMSSQSRLRRLTC